MEPADQFYGDRTYTAADLEGHYWTFSQPVRNVSNEEMERDTGFNFNKFRRFGASNVDGTLPQRLPISRVRRGVIDITRATHRQTQATRLSFPAMSRHLDAAQESVWSRKTNVRLPCPHLPLKAQRQLRRSRTWLEETDALWARQLSALKAHLQKSRR